GDGAGGGGPCRTAREPAGGAGLSRPPAARLLAALRGPPGRLHESPIGDTPGQGGLARPPLRRLGGAAVIRRRRRRRQVGESPEIAALLERIAPCRIASEQALPHRRQPCLRLGELGQEI